MRIELTGGPRDGQVVEVPDNCYQYCVPEISPIDPQAQTDVTSTCSSIHCYEQSIDGMGYPSLNDSGQYRFSYRGMTQ
jgi:hypothetical protein